MKSHGYRFDFADWDGDEYLAILRSMVSDFRKRLQTLLETEFPTSDVILLNSARGGLFIILDRLGRAFPGRKQVLVPSYICPSVPETIKKAGLEPIQVEVGDDLNISVECLEQYITEKTLAAICVHMYGKPMDIEQAERICTKHNLFLIDDAAQLGAGGQDKRACGGYGDFGLVSFAQSKSIVTGVRGSGGVLLVNSDRGKAIVRKEDLVLGESKGRAAQLLYFYMGYIRGRTFGKTLYYWERLKHHMNLKSRNYYEIGRISNTEAAIACAQYGSLRERMRNQREKIRLAGEILGENRYFSLPQVKENSYVTRLMLQLNRPEELGNFRNQLSRSNISTRLGYDPGKGLLEIPCKGGISISKFEEMCRQINMITSCRLEADGK